MMRPWSIAALLLVAVNARGQSTASTVWEDLKAKREALPGLHQEFEVTRKYETARTTQSSKVGVVVDMSGKKWRERFVSGAGDRIRIFDGQDILLLEEGGDEYARTKRKSKGDDPAPEPYGSIELDWTKGKQLDGVPCGFGENDHSCVLLQAPVKAQIRLGASSQVTRILGGVAQLAIDTQTGMLVQYRSRVTIENPRTDYAMEVSYSLKRMSFGKVLEPDLFQLPDTASHEVKELSAWSVSRIKKQLVGKLAPGLEATDIQANPISLSALKGKTVLLDFWTTWCPPCRADAPELDKLYAKYGGKDLAIVGISVNEDRQIVEKFLKEHPHQFPIVLTSENEMPRPYQVGAFPTYIVIASDGTLASVADGDQGFGELRKFLKKAGMDTE
jgi:thiol-disulfide isomerase/thioredoxin